jgi:import inner membrane translocase subunit TIM22
MKDAWRDLRSRGLRFGKQFAAVGAVFALSECVIESYRAKHDIYNSVSSGCVTGAVFGASGGPTSALTGCAAFAAFSAAVDHFMDK